MSFHTVICYCKTEKLIPLPLSLLLIRRLARHLKLTISHEPASFFYSPPKGCTTKPYLLIIPVQQSHIAVETWPELQLYRIIIDSCKKIDTTTVREFLKQEIRPKNLVIKELYHEVED